jgi:hypothetical protein
MEVLRRPPCQDRLGSGRRVGVPGLLPVSAQRRERVDETTNKFVPTVIGVWDRTGGVSLVSWFGIVGAMEQANHKLGQGRLEMLIWDPEVLLHQP